MSAAPDTDFVNAAATLLSLTVGTDIVDGPQRAASNSVQTRAVFVWCLGSGSIMNYLNNGSASLEHYTTTVRVLVRSNGQQYADGRSLARSIRNAMHDVPPTGYIACRSRTSEPTYYGLDDEGSHLFGLDFDMIYST